MNELGNLLPFLIVLLVFYALVIRPARRRQREQLRLQESLAPGQEVITTSGLIAKISSVGDHEVVLEAAPGVALRYAKPAIGRVLPADDAPDEQGHERSGSPTLPTE